MLRVSQTNKIIGIIFLNIIPHIQWLGVSKLIQIDWLNDATLDSLHIAH